MTSRNDNDLASRLDALDTQRARRVARLVLECSASLRDALVAVEDADRQTGDIALPGDAGAANELAPLNR